MPTWTIVADDPDQSDTLLALFSIWGVGGTVLINEAEAEQGPDDIEADSVETNIPELSTLSQRLANGECSENVARLCCGGLK